jgi:hypothetical protein
LARLLGREVAVLSVGDLVQRDRIGSLGVRYR